MKRNFPGHVTSMERHQPIPNIKGKLASTQKKSSKETYYMLPNQCSWQKQICFWYAKWKKSMCCQSVCFVLTTSVGETDLLHMDVFLFTSLDCCFQQHYVWATETSLWKPIFSLSIDLYSLLLAPQVWYYWPSLDYFHFQFSVSHLILQDSFKRSKEYGIQKWSSWGHPLAVLWNELKAKDWQVGKCRNL